MESISSVKVIVKLAAFVKLLADEGTLYDEQKFRIIDHKEKIYEFKPTGYRFFGFFFIGRKIVITNGYHKKTQKVDKKRIKAGYTIKKGLYQESKRR